MTAANNPSGQLFSQVEPWPRRDTPLWMQWENLASHVNCNPSLWPGWAEIARAGIAGADDEFAVFAARRQDASLEGLVPFYVSTRRIAGVGMRMLQLASNLISYHAQLLAPNGTHQLLGQFLAAAPRWDVLSAANIEIGSSTDLALRAVAQDLGGVLHVITGDVSPYLPLAGTWDQLVSGKGKKFRYKLRRRSELLERPDCTLRWFERTEDVDQLLECVLAIESRSWKSQAGLDITSRDFETKYHQLLLPYLAREQMLCAGVLYIEKVPAAYSLCCQFGTWFGHLKTSYDERFASLSAGAMVIDASIRKAFTLGAREFDFLGNSAEHKLAWTNLTRTHAHFFLYAPRLKPRAIGSLKLFRETLRRRKVAETLPES
jgi:CelD/BcsL family acetyltransferase involved in cellulose biosynthesis